MDISRRQVTEESFLIDEQTDIFLKSNQTPFRSYPKNFKHLNYNLLFSQMNPDILVAIQKSLSLELNFEIQQRTFFLSQD